METGIARPPWTNGEVFAFVDNTMVVIRAPFLIAYQIKQLSLPECADKTIQLTGMCITIDDAKVPSYFTMTAIAKQL